MYSQLQMEFLCEHSQLFRGLYEPGEIDVSALIPPDSSATIEEIEKQIKLLVDIYNEKISIFAYMKGKSPFYSLEGVTREQIEQLIELCRYLLLPELLINKLVIAKTCLVTTKRVMYGPHNDKIGEVILLPIIQKYLNIDFRQFHAQRPIMWATIGDIDGLGWSLEKTGGKCSQALCLEAIKGGHIDCLQWICGRGCSLDKTAGYYAAFCGQFECLRWLYENGAPFGQDTLREAARSGRGNSMACVMYLHSHGYACDAWISDAAAGGGNLDVLKYIRSIGEHWSPDIANICVKAGQLECLKYVLQHGAVCTIDVFFLERSCSYRERQVRECCQYLLGYVVPPTPLFDDDSDW